MKTVALFFVPFWPLLLQAFGLWPLAFLLLDL